MTDERGRGRLETAESVLGYLKAGHGKMTLVSVKSGNRYTYRFGTPRDITLTDKTPIFVRVLYSQDNNRDYRYIGCLWPHGDALRYAHGQKSNVSWDAPSVQAMTWVSKWLERGILPQTVEVWHEGVCGKCGRTLTVPESIERGFGPVCAGSNGEK